MISENKKNNKNIKLHEKKKGRRSGLDRAN